MTRFALPTAIVSAFVVGGFVAVFFVFLNHNRNSGPCPGCLRPRPVFVAKVSIPKGTSGRVIGTKGLYSTKMARVSQMVKGALIDPSQFRGEITTRPIAIKVTSLLRGEFDPSKFRDIKGPVAVPVPLQPMPIGVQVIAAPWREDIALRVAYALAHMGVAVAPPPRGL